jgi:hypothetical protein
MLKKVGSLRRLDCASGSPDCSLHLGVFDGKAIARTGMEVRVLAAGADIPKAVLTRLRAKMDIVAVENHAKWSNCPTCLS